MSPRETSGGRARARRERSRLRPGSAVIGVVLGLAAAAGPAAPAHAAQARGYEMVSPLDKGGMSVTRPDGGSYSNGNSAASTIVLPDGNGIAYVAGGAFAGTESSTGVGQPYLSLRGPDGWTTDGLGPPFNPPTSLTFGIVMGKALTPDGARAVVQTPARLTPGAPACTLIICPQQLYLRDNARHSYRLINPAPIPGGNVQAAFGAATPSLDRVLFTSTAQVVPDGPADVQNLYEWIDDGTPDGQVRLAGLGPDGQPLPNGSVPGEAVSGLVDTVYDRSRAFSADGRRIFFTSPDADTWAERLYLREDGKRTVLVSASQRTDCADGGPCTGAPSPDPAGPMPARYVTADGPHGSAVFFTSEEQLTDDSRATAGQPDLYRYDVETDGLADVTAGAAAPANVQGLVGASDDASILYFTANAQLVSGKGTADEPNLYRWQADGSDNGKLTFVATLGADDAASNWSGGGGGILPQRVSSDGRYLALLTHQPLGDESTNGTAQVYRYDAERGGTPECVSCTTDADGSTMDASFRLDFRKEAVRVVSEDGRVAFQTDEALRPTDTNGTMDVYLYEDGAPQLVSSGHSPDLSVSLGMDPTGQNVFFATREPLVAQDSDDLIDVYDARVGGGIAPPAPATPCAAEDCKAAPTAAPEPSAAPSVFVGGPGNVTPSEPPAAPTAASFRVSAISASQRRSWARSGQVALSVRIAAAGTVTARVRGRISKRTVTVATARRTAKQAGTVRLSLRLTKAAEAYLKRHHQLRVTVTVAHSRVRKAQQTTLTLRPAAAAKQTKAKSTSRATGAVKGQR